MNKLDHVAFIMDGNGRWGKKRGKGRNFGHFTGVKVVKKIVESSIKQKVPIVTYYVFSTENWKRPKSEIKFLFNLIKSYFLDELKNVIDNGIKINIIGDIKKLPTNLSKILLETTSKTKNNKKILVNLALNYGSRDKTDKKEKKNFSKNNFSKPLYKKFTGSRYFNKNWWKKKVK